LFELVKHADLPAVHPMKPCFAENVAGPSGEQGTSYACAALAGKCAMWDGRLGDAERRRAAGKFGKLALLMAQSGEGKWLSEHHEAGLATPCWVRPRVLVFDSAGLP